MPIKIFLPITLILIIISCSDKKSITEQSHEMPRVINKEVLVTNDDCLPDSINCTYIKIDFPSVLLTVEVVEMERESYSKYLI